MLAVIFSSRRPAPNLGQYQWRLTNKPMKRSQPMLHALKLVGWSLIPFLTLIGSGALAQESRIIQTPAPYNACNLREGPGIRYAAIGTFRDGTLVTFAGARQGGWYAVRIGTTNGWMARQCLGL
jgi:uncharacterized protein YgiM (DUF1202 family)